ncbi:Myb-like DNA-binding domain containing protein [Tritrichomonas foetus]|uniref:Myb-like DNA-binding domain containing protein n=1 Tax=Tritrichomonas foetus TaxID=1144522 RepID=A0A1J4JRH6_9EUKA|nr:Myb-like DNA-binding domain containing protein [Tritrichomonas foetus]|eukprot:OHS99852.1 Myb-like DNA-binding domain containing protein [Tritrichomonas foetus]
MLAATSKKHPFSVKEDLEILQFVQTQGTKNWRVIALQLGRTPKQCRERWNGHLNPNINKGPWTHSEDVVLATKQHELGNKWAEISKFLPGRTDAIVKNRWNTSVKNRASELLSSLPNSPIESISYSNSSYHSNSNSSCNSPIPSNCCFNSNSNCNSGCSSTCNSPVSDAISHHNSYAISPNNTYNMIPSNNSQISLIAEINHKFIEVTDWLMNFNEEKNQFLSLASIKSLPPLVVSSKKLCM